MRVRREAAHLTGLGAPASVRTIRQFDDRAQGRAHDARLILPRAVQVPAGTKGPTDTAPQTLPPFSHKSRSKDFPNINE